MSGTSLQQLMELGAWKSYEMVPRCARLAPEHLAGAAKRIERTWDVVAPNATISLRYRKKGSRNAEAFESMARPERFALPTPGS